MRPDVKRLVRLAVAVVLAAFSVAVVDLGIRFPEAWAWEVAGLILVGVPILAVAAGLRFTGPHRGWELAGLGLLALGPLVPVAIGRGGALIELWGLTIVLAVMIPVGGALTVRALVQRTQASWAAVVAAAALLVIPTALVGWAEGTLIRIRPGTEPLHLQLFVFTWLSCFGLAVPIGLALGRGWLGRATGRWLLVAVGLLLAAGLSYVDRTRMVGLYPAVHAWLQWTAGLCVVAALSLALQPFDARLDRRWGTLALAFVGMAGVGIWLDARARHDIVFRASIAQGEIGRSLLRLRPMVVDDAGVSASDPRLEHERMHGVEPPSRGLNLVLITVDTLRADAIGQMPRVSALAAESTVFERAYAPAPATYFSLPAILAGRQVTELDWGFWLVSWEGDAVPIEPGQRLGRLDHDFFVLADDPPGGGLAMRLRANDYTTLAVADGGISEFLRPANGYGTGFDHYEVLPGGIRWPTSDVVVRKALAAVDEAGSGSWYLWVHLFDPHRAEREEDEYARLVSVTDEAIGELLDGLKARGVWGKTALVLTSDHGEAFGEHGYRGHDSSLYEEQLHVPLILRIPGLAARVQARPASAIDVAPTLAILGGASSDGMTGVNLLPAAIDGTYPRERPVLAEHLRYGPHTQRRLSDQKAVILGDQKLIWDRRTETLELFDLASDPDEEASRLWESPDVAQDLQQLLRGYVWRREHAPL